MGPSPWTNGAGLGECVFLFHHFNALWNFGAGSAVFRFPLCTPEAHIYYTDNELEQKFELVHPHIMGEVFTLMSNRFFDSNVRSH